MCSNHYCAILLFVDAAIHGKLIEQYGEYCSKITLTIKKPIGLGICYFHKPMFPFS